MADTYYFTLTVTKQVGADVDANRTVTILNNRHFTENQLSALAHIFEHAGQDPVPPGNRLVIDDPRAGEQPVPQFKGQLPEGAVVVVSQFHPDDMRPSPADRVAQTQAARAQGYTGDVCSNCMGVRVKVSGHCTVCEDCGTTSGCS